MLEAFNQVVKKASSRAAVLTIACNDTHEAVTKFMDETGYTFRVAMGNRAIVKAYEVRGYPTRIAVTPSGHRFEVPFGADWRKVLTPFFLGQ